MNPSHPHNAPGPLEGIRVVEYAVFHAGPGASAILADLGADVVKIESPSGDPVRDWLTVGNLDMTMKEGGSFMHEVSNRGKRGVVLDIHTANGREAFHRLVEGADVFITNLRKSTKTKLGVDWPSLKKINPRLIHACVSGYGPEGPLADLGAFDPLGCARSGMMFITGSEEPRLIHLAVLDQAAAIAASHAVLAALFTRERNGAGQEVHVSLLSTGLWLTYANLMLNEFGVDPTLAGGRENHSPLRNVFKCKDGEWIIGTHHPEERYWSTFLKATGRDDLAGDPRFVDDAARAENREELIRIFDEVFAGKTRTEWMEVFVAYGLMFNAIQKLSEIRRDPQVLENGYMVPFDHPRLGPITIPGYPAHFSENGAGARRAAPTLGEHTREVLEELGYSEEDILALMNGREK